MKRIRLALSYGLLVLTCLLVLNINSASAIKQFSDQFKEKYLKDPANTPEEKALTEAFAKAKCNVCHDPNSKSKKDHNPYGKELAKLLDKKADMKDKEKIQEALTKVEGMKSKTGDEKSPTYGELIKQGKLPAEQ